MLSLPARTLLLLGIPATLAAQAPPRYSPTGVDTLRYAEQTLDISTLETPTGIVTQQTTQSSRIALRLAIADHGEAWYEQLDVQATGPQGDKTAATSALLGRKFLLSHDSRGHVIPDSFPEIPAAIDSLTDLRHQFDDFLIILPEAPLFPGLEWSDSVRRESSRGEGRRTTLVVRRSYRVTRDTIAMEGAAWVIVTSAELELESITPAPGSTLRVVSHQVGAESGTDLWSRVGGRMLARTRRGELQGKVTIVGGTEPIELPQLRRYESTIRLLPPY